MTETIAPHGLRAPDKSGKWHAWRVRRLAKGSLATWLLHCPELHAAWSYWLLSLMPLRDIPGLPAAQRNYPTATHELMVFALDPRRPPDPENPQDLALMRPVDQHEQFDVGDDDDAVEFADRMVELVVAGRLPPDTDYRVRWHAAVVYLLGRW